MSCSSSGLFPLLTPEQMAELDRKTIDELGIPSLVLMESAAIACLGRLLEEDKTLLRQGVGVFCGPGNNGADGFAIARRLHLLGFPVRCFLATGREQLSKEASLQAEWAESLGVPILEEGAVEEWAAAIGENCELQDAPGFAFCVDALFGTGLARPLEGLALTLTKRTEVLRAKGVKVLAVDVPSGICGETGQVRKAAISADFTVTFALPKRGHFLEPGRTHTGELMVADIGIPTSHWPEVASRAPLLLDASFLRRSVPNADPSAHKGTMGRVLVVAGSPGMGGAARLCAEGALRSGAGLVTLALAEGLDDPGLHDLGPEVMVRRLPTDSPGRFDLRSLPELKALADGQDAVAVGPGLGTADETVSALLSLLDWLEVPTVIDADGLNAIAMSGTVKLGPGPRLLTPHPGEAKRLLGGAVIGRENRIALVHALEERFECAVLLKGAGSLALGVDKTCFLNPTGNPGLATAGTGDVLAGVSAALLARGLKPLVAGACASYWHGLAGDLAAEAIGEPSIIAGDVLAALGPAWQLIEADRAPRCWRIHPSTGPDWGFGDE